MRILIIGWPGTGKTTLAKKMARETGLEHYSTDPQNLCFLGERGIPIDLDWSAGSKYVADTLLGRPNSIIEGVAVPRALRKWKEAHPGEHPPCDQIIRLKTPKKELTQGQVSMGKGVDSVLEQLSDWLCKVQIEYRE